MPELVYGKGVQPKSIDIPGWVIVAAAVFLLILIVGIVDADITQYGH